MPTLPTPDGFLVHTKHIRSLLRGQALFIYELDCQTSALRLRLFAEVPPVLIHDDRLLVAIDASTKNRSVSPYLTWVLERLGRSRGVRLRYENLTPAAYQEAEQLERL